MEDGEFSREMLFRRVSKRPIPETPDVLEGIDFTDYGDRSTFRHSRDTFRDTGR